MKTKRTYFFQMFGKTASGRIGEVVNVWNEEGEKHIVVLKQKQRYSDTTEILWYTLDGSNWLALEKGKRTESGKERADFYYHN